MSYCKCLRKKMEVQVGDFWMGATTRVRVQMATERSNRKSRIRMQMRI